MAPIEVLIWYPCPLGLPETPQGVARGEWLRPPADAELPKAPWRRWTQVPAATGASEEGALWLECVGWEPENSPPSPCVATLSALVKADVPTGLSTLSTTSSFCDAREFYLGEYGRALRRKHVSKSVIDFRQAAGGVL